MITKFCGSSIFINNASNTYAFSSYVNGTLGLGFSQSRDLQLRNSEGKPLVQRSLRLEAAATFRF